MLRCVVFLNTLRAKLLMGHFLLKRCDVHFSALFDVDRACFLQPGMDSYMVSPITGEKVPAGKIQEHMRFGLLDPSWKELKRKQIAEKQQEEEVFAAGGRRSVLWIRDSFSGTPKINVWSN